MFGFSLIPTLKVTDLITSLSVVCAACTLIYTWTKDRRLRSKEYADKIRAAASLTLSRTDRCQILFKSITDEAQPTITDIDDLMVTQKDSALCRDKLWKELNNIRAKILQRFNDEELETILTRAYSAGAREGSYVVLRLPGELRDMFREWLQVHYPDRLKRAISLMQSMREGKDYEARWGRRMAGSGPYAWMIGRRFEMATRRLGYRETSRALRVDLFRKPAQEASNAPAKLSLF